MYGSLLSFAFQSLSYCVPVNSTRRAITINIIRYLTVHYKVDWNERVNEAETSETRACMTSGSSACLAPPLTNVGDKYKLEQASDTYWEPYAQKPAVWLVFAYVTLCSRTQSYRNHNRYTSIYKCFLQVIGNGIWQISRLKKLSLIYQLFKKPLISVCSKLWSVNGLWISRRTRNGCGCCLTSNTARRNCSVERIVYHIRRLKLLRARIYSILIWAL